MEPMICSSITPRSSPTADIAPSPRKTSSSSK
ncbi:hypothetical protein LINPERPRIM_LOCUS2731 [Linum perenne]